MARKRLGKYEIIDRIGRGGMAEVYRGYHAALDRYVAIKLLHPFLADDPEFKDRFENEARNVAKLKHPNIVQVYDFEYDVEGDSYYMVMEMINGPTLKDKLFELSLSGEQLPVSEAIRITRTSAEALAYAHQRGMIHRDVKPANLMLDEDQRVVLTDFGIAKIVTSAQFTASGGMVGTPAYMAPEQGLGEMGDERSDIYSLGVILYQLLTQHLPFDADTPLAIILKHVNEPAPSPRTIYPDIAEDLEAIVLKSLAKEPSERFGTAAAFAQALAELDPTGRRLSAYDTQQIAIQGEPLASTDSKPTAPTPLDLERANQRASTPPPSQPSATASTGATPGSPDAVPGGAGRLRPASILGLVLLIAVFVIAGVLVFGSDRTLFAGFFGEDDTVTPALNGTGTAIAQQPTNAPPVDDTEIPIRVTSTPSPTVLATHTPRPTLTDTPTPTTSPTPSPSSTPTATGTNTPTATSTPEPTATDTPIPTATITPSPTPTYTPSPDLTGTAAYEFFEAQSLVTRTPNMTQTIVACDFEFIVVEPDDFDEPPPSTGNDPRHVQAGTDFSFEIILRNTGTCDWPDGTRLSFNDTLTTNPGEEVNLNRLQSACENARQVGLNFAEQEQSNFYIDGSVPTRAESDAVIFTGTAPDRSGCYYSVWDVLYPNSDITIGRPLLLTIRVWGSAN